MFGYDLDFFIDCISSICSSALNEKSMENNRPGTLIVKHESTTIVRTRFTDVVDTNN